MSWQPISQPPAYDAEVLLWVPDSEPAIIVGKLCANADDGDSDYFVPSENLVAEVIGAIEGATHWMPLPEPPQP